MTNDNITLQALALGGIFLAVPIFCLVSAALALSKIWTLHRVLDHAGTRIPGGLAWLGLIPFAGPVFFLGFAVMAALVLRKDSRVGARALAALPWIAVSMVGLLTLQLSYPFVSARVGVLVLVSLASSVVYLRLLSSDLQRMRTPLAVQA